MDSNGARMSTLPERAYVINMVGTRIYALWEFKPSIVLHLHNYGDTIAFHVDLVHAVSSNVGKRFGRKSSVILYGAVL